ncbi:MAG: hypothetical protein ACI4AD_03100 [Roseburia sp.]
MFIRKFMLLESQDEGRSFLSGSCETGGIEYGKGQRLEEKLGQLVENDAYYRHMDEDAYDVVAWYTNSTELMQTRDYQREDGKIDMCTAIREMMEDSRREGMAAGIAEGMATGIAEGMATGIAEGMTTGISTGIKALIETCRELGLSREDTLLRTANKFNICKDEAEDYMAQYWI